MRRLKVALGLSLLIVAACATTPEGKAAQAELLLKFAFDRVDNAVANGTLKVKPEEVDAFKDVAMLALRAYQTSLLSDGPEQQAAKYELMLDALGVLLDLLEAS